MLAQKSTSRGKYKEIKIGYLLYSNALLRWEMSSDGGDNGGAVVAGVGHGHGQKGGGEEENLHGGGLSSATELQENISGKALSQHPEKSHVQDSNLCGAPR